LRRDGTLSQSIAEPEFGKAYPMKTWRKPQVREISAAMEINCYASAE